VEHSLLSLVPLLLGSLLGLVSGLIPGIGNFVLLMIATPIILTMSPIDIIIVYVALTSISQYIGSIPATLLGIAGESSSFPVVVESSRLSTPESISEAINGAALGSFFGSFVVVIMCLLLLPQLDFIKYVFSTKIYLIVLLVATVVICIISNKNIFISIFMLLVGLFLGSIGYNAHYQTPFLAFDNIYLYSGLPFILISIVLFAIPQMLQNMASKDDKISIAITKPSMHKLNLPLSVLYSFIGFIGGLFPGLTTILSSYLAYMLSSYITTDPVKRIVASETANNSGAFSQLLPLLLFSIPLVSSEAYLLNILEMRGFYLENISIHDLLIPISVSLIFINLLGVILAWPLSKYLLYVYTIKLEYIFYSIIIILLAISLYVGYTHNSLIYYALTIIGLSPIAYYFRKANTTPLVFAFLIHDSLLDNLIRLPLLM